jgi:hypothetical protein
MKHARAFACALALAWLPSVAVAQPADEDEADEGTIHEDDEVIGPDGVEPPPPDDAPPPSDPPSADKAKPTGNTGYDKGFFIKSDDGKFSLKMTGRVHSFLALTRAKTPAADWTGAFEIRQARLVLDGHLHGKNLKYRVQTDFGRGNPSLRDFLADAHLGAGVWVRAGQWKRPFSRQFMASSGRLEIPERAITDRAFGTGRDIGVALHNGYEDSPAIEWTFGVWNGTGEAATTRVTTDPMTGTGTATTSNVPREFKPAFVGRIGINSPGIKGYSEADLEGGPLRWAAAASFWGEADFDRNDQSNDRVELDFIVKAQGFSGSGAFYAMTQQAGTHVLSDQELAYIGFHAQVGYMLTPSWQGAGRFAMVDGRQDGLIDTKEIAVGGTYYGWGHDAKIAADVRLLKTGEAKFTDAVSFTLAANVGF